MTGPDSRPRRTFEGEAVQSVLEALEDGLTDLDATAADYRDLLIRARPFVVAAAGFPSYDTHAAALAGEIASVLD